MSQGESSQTSTQKQGMNHKVFNDAVHGHMTFHPLLVKIIDTCEFQRLRNLKQLGLAYFVYPSACHNRFEHSLGTCHMARKLLEALEKTDMEIEYLPSKEEKLCVLIAALCHDLGHGPFSHTYEIFLKRARQNDAGIPEWKHEEASVLILEKILNKDGIKEMMKKYGLSNSHIQLIKNLINVPEKRDDFTKYYLTQIVSNKDNDVDVDKWDYILRDQLQLNIQNNFDPDRLLNFCQVLWTKKERTEICYRDKEVGNLLDMLIARATLHHKAYQHPVVKIIETMLVDALLLANKACPKWGLANTKTDNFLTLTDHVYQNILYSKDKRLERARALLERVETRKLYKVLCKYSWDEKYSAVKNKYNDLLEMSNDLGHYMNEDCDWMKPEDVQVVLTKIDMGTKFEGLLKCFVFEKNSKNPKQIENKESFNHILAKSLEPVLIEDLMVLYKGEIEDTTHLIKACDRFFNDKCIQNGEPPAKKLRN